MREEITENEPEGRVDDLPGHQLPTSTGPPPERREPTTPAAPGSDRVRQRALAPSEHYAAHLHETSGSAYLYCSMAQVFREVGPESFKLYLLKVMEDAGNPTDPIERMLVEQICLAHHNIGRLHVKAASAQSLEEARIYVGAAALLTGEFRRCVLALKAYRGQDKVHGRQAGGYARRPDRPARRGRHGPSQGEPDGGQGNTTGASDDGEETIPFREPEAGGGREVERPQAKGLTPEGLERLRAAAR